MCNTTNDIDYSIVICAYNPDERILIRCLAAVHNLDTTGIRTEVILSDNNSTFPVSGLGCVKDLSAKIPLMQTIMVAEQGVKYARMAAIERAKGKYIVYIDYDNEPAADYLQQLKKLNALYPEVAAWGPGNVRVDFIDGIEKRIEEYARAAFQERHEKGTRFSTEHSWQSCYPFGTGLCTHAFLLKEYVQLAKQGVFTLQGRKANRLSSGEDTQMVLLCISRGYAAGVSPTLKLNHMIPQSRANKKYLRRLAYGTAECYETCLTQVFPDRKNELVKNVIPPFKFTTRALKKLLKTIWSSEPNSFFELSAFIGINAGAYHALGRRPPAVIKKMINFFELQ
jgi:hypothetical protein